VASHQHSGALAIALFWTWLFAPLLCQDKSGKEFDTHKKAAAIITAAAFNI
jgi:hypothetical protein